MWTSTTEIEAIKIADAYRIKYHNHLEGKILKYELINTNYFTNSIFDENPIWEITYDVAGWDDIWYAIIISDIHKKVICCSNMWKSKYFPHID